MPTNADALNLIRDLLEAAQQARNLILDQQDTGPGERAIARQLGKAIRPARKFLAQVEPRK